MVRGSGFSATPSGSNIRVGFFSGGVAAGYGLGPLRGPRRVATADPGREVRTFDGLWGQTRFILSGGNPIPPKREKLRAGPFCG